MRHVPPQGRALSPKPAIEAAPGERNSLAGVCFARPRTSAKNALTKHLQIAEGLERIVEDSVSHRPGQASSPKWVELFGYATDQRDISGADVGQHRSRRGRWAFRGVYRWKSGAKLIAHSVGSYRGLLGISAVAARTTSASTDKGVAI